MTPDVVGTIRNLSRWSNEFLYGISKPYFPELIKLRGGIIGLDIAYKKYIGSLLKALVDKMNYKIVCNTTENWDKDHCKWMQNLKYYAYSAVSKFLAV